MSAVVKPAAENLTQEVSAAICERKSALDSKEHTPKVRQQHTTPGIDKSKPKGRLPKPQTFTRERAGSSGCIEDFLKRKRSEDEDTENLLSDVTERSQHPKKMNTGSCQSSSMNTEVSPAQLTEITNAKVTPIVYTSDNLTPEAQSIAKMFEKLTEYINSNTSKLELQIMQSQLKNEQAIQQTRQEFTGQIAKISERQGKLEEEVKTIKAINQSISSNQLSAPTIEADTKLKIRKLEELMDQQEKLVKQLNVVVKNHNWSEVNLLRDANEFFEKNFNLPSAIESAISINRERKVVRVKFNNASTKEAVMSSKARVLKNSRVSLNHDLTKRAQHCVSKLTEAAKEARNTGKSAKVTGTRLRMESDWYYWDTDNEALKLIRKNNPLVVPSHSLPPPKK